MAVCLLMRPSRLIVGHAYLPRDILAVVLLETFYKGFEMGNMQEYG